MIKDNKNNLLIKFPHIAKLWHPTLNGQKKPEHYAPYSNLVFYWKCKSCKKDFKKTVEGLTRDGRGICSDCKNKLRTSWNKKTAGTIENEFNSINELAGNKLQLIKITYEVYKTKKLNKNSSSKDKRWIVYYKCKKNNHEDYKDIKTLRSRGALCPKCQGYGTDIEEKIKNLHKIHNHKYSYDEFRKEGYINADLKITIRCREHGLFKKVYHKHQMGQGCIKCAKRYSLNGRELKEFIKSKSEGRISSVKIINEKSYKTHNMIELKCNVHFWHPNQKRRLSEIKAGSLSCIYCTASTHALTAYHSLHVLGVDYEIERKIVHDDGSLQFIDIVIKEKNSKEIFIEIDGEQHFFEILWNKEKNLSNKFLKDNNERDAKKDKYAISKGIRLFRIKYNDDIKLKINNIINSGDFIRKKPNKFFPVSMIRDKERVAFEVHELYKKGYKNKEIQEKLNLKSSFVSKVVTGKRYYNLFLHFYPSGKNINIKSNVGFNWSAEEKKFVTNLLAKKEHSQVKIRKIFEKKFNKYLSRSVLFRFNKKL
jgi:hypothetical protein